MGVLKYKNFIGSVEYSEADKLLYGKVIGIKGLISYEGKDVDALELDFRAGVDEYLEICREKGVSPQKSYTGAFNVRISPDTHAKIAELSQKAGISLNAFIKETLQKAIM